MACKTSATASMLQSPSFSSQHGLVDSAISSIINSSARYYNPNNALNLSTHQVSRPQQFYFPNSSISTLNSHPTITLDLTTPPTSSSNSSFTCMPKYSSTNLNFSSGFSPLHSQHSFPNPIVAATEAIIRSNPKFQSALATALTTYVGNEASSGRTRENHVLESAELMKLKLLRSENSIGNSRNFELRSWSDEVEEVRSMPKKGASMEEGVGLQCQRAEVNVKERSKQKGVGFTARRKQAESSRVHSKEKASRGTYSHEVSMLVFGKLCVVARVVRAFDDLVFDVHGEKMDRRWPRVFGNFMDMRT
ncbi:uncharacterized protein LOC114397036 [Glycine soja]|uniref:uncharacterized protein LOC114397036 n=1 Tax=Glycine soja TaxID=3848 RepID=UPI00104002AB|nr:uncharacterized protein LOC114397036 [Glycine soja]